MGRQQQRSKQRQRQRQRLQQQRKETPAGAPNTRGATPASPTSSGRPWLGIAAGAAAVVVVVAVITMRTLGGSSPAKQAPVVGAAVDGLRCAATEKTAEHFHQHVELYYHGTRVNLPSDIGIPLDQPGNEFSAICFYWLHVHLGDINIIHTESPVKKTFTFGQFLDVWKATYKTATPSSDTFVKQLESAPRSQIHAFLDGKPWTSGVRSIPLKPHAVIAVEIGKPVVPPKPFTNWQGL